MLANLYMNRFLKYWRITGRGEAFQAQVVKYADDFVILSRHHAAEALNWTRNVVTRIGLTLNETKTSIKAACQEQFDFRLHIWTVALSEERRDKPACCWE